MATCGTCGRSLREGLGRPEGHSYAVCAAQITANATDRLAKAIMDAAQTDHERNRQETLMATYRQLIEGLTIIAEREGMDTDVPNGISAVETEVWAGSAKSGPKNLPFGWVKKLEDLGWEWVPDAHGGFWALECL